MTQQQYNKLRQVIIEANPEKFILYHREVRQRGCTDCAVLEKPGHVDSEETITLADILLAIKENVQGFNEKYKAMSTIVPLVPDFRNSLQWNLTEDNLDDQSDELKQFLYDVLVEGGG